MKRLVSVVSMLVLVCALATVVGCGDSSDKSADTGNEAAAKVHDCAGGCGMKDVAADQMTEVDGKHYCAGCAKEAKEAKEGDHSGHGHG